MKCPRCNEDALVINSRPISKGKARRRRYSCPSCGLRFRTYEMLHEDLIKIKRNASNALKIQEEASNEQDE